MKKFLFEQSLGKRLRRFMKESRPSPRGRMHNQKEPFRHISATLCVSLATIAFDVVLALKFSLPLAKTCEF